MAQKMMGQGIGSMLSILSSSIVSNNMTFVYYAVITCYSLVPAAPCSTYYLSYLHQQYL
jgi:hypothetical protein